MKIIDSHVHFWNLSLLRYPWLESETTLNRTFLPSDFPAVSDDLEGSGVVFVQADCLPEQGIAEVNWVTKLAADFPIRGIVAFAPLEQGDDVRPTLAALAENSLVKGVRRLI